MVANARISAEYYVLDFTLFSKSYQHKNALNGGKHAVSAINACPRDIESPFLQAPQLACLDRGSVA